MPRRARHFVPNALFHAGARGVDRQPIFLTDADRRFFIDSMTGALAESNIKTAGYCLMPNHFHWAIATGEGRFDRAFHSAMLGHAVRFNRLYGRTGHLFEARHWSFHCSDLENIENLISYIHMNPVRAGLVRHPRDWQWSSFREWSSGAPSITDIGRTAELAGCTDLELRARHNNRVASDLKGGPKGLGVQGLIRDVASTHGMSAETLKTGKRGGINTLMKEKLLDRCAEENINLDELAQALGCTPEALFMIRARRLTKVPVPSVSR